MRRTLLVREEHLGGSKDVNQGLLMSADGYGVDTRSSLVKRVSDADAQMRGATEPRKLEEREVTGPEDHAYLLLPGGEECGVIGFCSGE